MRKLKTSDVPAFIRCIKSIGIKDELKKMAISQESDQTAAGFEVIYTLLDLASEKSAEARIYEFLAPIFEISPEELAGLDLAEFIVGIQQLAAENDLGPFFKSAAAMMK